jgi:hypothetical protein
MRGLSTISSSSSFYSIFSSFTIERSFYGRCWNRTISDIMSKSLTTTTSLNIKIIYKTILYTYSDVLVELDQVDQLPPSYLGTLLEGEEFRPHQVEVSVNHLSM